MEQEKIATTLTDHENRVKVCEHRIKDLEETTKRIETLTLSVEKLAVSVERMANEQVEYRDKQNELAKKILEVEQAPTKAKAKIHDDIWQSVGRIVIGAIVGAILTYIGFA